MIDFLWQLLIGGCFLLGIYQWVINEWVKKRHILQPLNWQMSLVDSLCLFWGVVVLIMVFQNLYLCYAKTYFLTLMGDPHWDYLGQGLAFHGGILLVGGLAFFGAKDWPGCITVKPFTRLLKMSGIAFCMVLPILWLAAYLWIKFLAISAQLGFAVQASEQNLVTLLAEIHDMRLIIAFGVLVIFIAPLTEEWFFRAGLYRFLKKYFGLKNSAITTSLIFACLHFNTLSFLPLFTLGMLFVYFYEMSEDWRVPYMIHALFNGYNFISILLLPDGECVWQGFSFIF